MLQQISLTPGQTLSASRTTEPRTLPCSAPYVLEMPSTSYMGHTALHLVKDAMSRKLTFTAMVQNRKCAVSRAGFESQPCHALAGKL